MTPPGIDPGTVRLVAQCLNHYATAGPEVECTLEIITSEAENAVPQVRTFQFQRNNTDVLAFFLRLNGPLLCRITQKAKSVTERMEFEGSDYLWEY